MSVEIMIGDARERLRDLADESVHCVVTSPPYFGLRDYGIDGQMGLEPTPADFVAGMVGLFREVRRVLRSDGTLWLNLGDSYAGARWAIGETGQMADRSVAAARCRTASTDMVVRGKRDAKRWGGGNAAHGGGIKPKDLIGIPWRVAFALQEDGWWLRQDIIWSKPNPMPESVRDRCTKAHEYLFLLSKSPRYRFDQSSIRERPAASTLQRLSQNDGNPKFDAARKRRRAGHIAGGDTLRPDQLLHPDGANKRSVWNVATRPFAGAHFATFPPELIEPCVLAGCPVGGTVLDPFGGAGTTGLVADRLGRDAILIEINPEYADLARTRLRAGYCRVSSEAAEAVEHPGDLFGSAAA